MRISYSCPAHLKFSLTVEQWTELVTLTSECIDWLDANERVYDVWLFVAYAATSCALVQVRIWALQLGALILTCPRSTIRLSDERTLRPKTSFANSGTA